MLVDIVCKQLDMPLLNVGWSCLQYHANYCVVHNCDCQGYGRSTARHR